MCILIVDDQKSLLLLLTTFLEGAGYAVVTASNGHEALTYLRGTSDLPSLILLDVAMPRMTGWEFLRAQQRDARLDAIPVVVMTALGPIDHQEVEPSVVACLQKPIDLTELEALLIAHDRPQLQTKTIGI